EGLTDQLVQIKMLNLPADYLEHYRDRVQAVTVAEIQRVAEKYIKPDEAAVIVVGDGTAVLGQIRPYCPGVEIYSTSGKRKSLDAPATTDLEGAWSVEEEAPLRHSLPAPRTLSREGQGFIAKILSEMGDADLGVVEVNDNSFRTTAFLEMDGHKVEAEVFARFHGDQAEGTLKLQNSPSLPFTGSKD